MANKIKSTFDKGVATVSIKSGVFIETTKIKSHINNLQEEISVDKGNVGRVFYEMWRTKNIDMQECERLCTLILEKENAIEKQLEKLEQIQSEGKQLLGEKQVKNQCACGTVNSPTAKFCYKCGSKLGS